MGFVGNLLLFAPVKEVCKSTIDKGIAMARVAPFFESRCTWRCDLHDYHKCHVSTMGVMTLDPPPLVAALGHM